MEEFQGGWDVFYVIQHLEMKEERKEMLFYVNVFVAWTEYSLEGLMFKLSGFLFNKTLKKFEN